MTFMRNILLAAFVLCATLAAHADDASKLAKVEEYFKLAKMDQLAAQTMSLAAAQVNSALMGNILGVTLTPEQQKQVDATQAQVMRVVQQAFGWDALEPEYAKLYAEAYTEEELDGMIAFYRSPSGQAMVEKTPGLMRQANTIVQARLGGVTTQLQQIIKDRAKQTPASAPK